MRSSPISPHLVRPGHPDGSLTALVPVDEATFKRLHLLQGQLTRNVQHTAGLNPRAFLCAFFALATRRFHCPAA